MVPRARTCCQHAALGPEHGRCKNGYPSSYTVFTQCRVLEAMSLDLSLVPFVADSGAVPILASQVSAGSELVAEQCAAVLANIALDDDASRRTAAAIAIPMLVGRLQMDEPHVSEQCIRALCNLACDSKLCLQIAQTDCAIEAFLRCAGNQGNET